MLTPLRLHRGFHEWPITHLQVVVICGSNADKDGAISRLDVLQRQPMQRGILCDLMRDHQAGRQRCVIHHLTPATLQQKAAL